MLHFIHNLRGVQTQTQTSQKTESSGMLRCATGQIVPDIYIL
jgi:hypothetical protein